MQILKMAGAKFTPLMFIDLYKEARKLSPPRFMTLRLHPDRYKELYGFAEVPESIQLGPVLGPLGRSIMRVCCVRCPSGVGDGIKVDEDPKCDPDKIYFEIHGQPEIIVEELYCDPTSKGSTSTPQSEKQSVISKRESET